jgi:hypothetical protein
MGKSLTLYFIDRTESTHCLERSQSNGHFWLMIRIAVYRGPFDVQFFSQLFVRVCLRYKCDLDVQ